MFNITVPLHGSPNYKDGCGAVGRNGHFRPVSAWVLAGARSETGAPYIVMDVNSFGGSPITLALSPEDMETLANTLLKAVQELRATL